MSAQKDIIAALSNIHQDIPQKDIDFAVKHVFDCIAQALSQKGRIELRNFGSFSTRVRKFSNKSSLKKDNTLGNRIINVVYYRASHNLLKKINKE